MLTKKKVLALHDLEDHDINYVKEICGFDFIQKLDEAYYCSDFSSDKSDLTNLLNLSDEINFDPNLIKFEINLSFSYIENLYKDKIKDIDKEREKRAKEKYDNCSKDSVGYGWRTVSMQLKDLEDTKRDCVQIKIFSLGKKDYYCYIV